MVDHVTAVRRSAMMARIKGKNTGPEIRVRVIAHAMGLRFRLHRTDLPGKPDVVFPKLKTALFVHGCFWHQHAGCRRASKPKSRTEYWEKKLRGNGDRDRAAASALQELGWRVAVIWECETHDPDQLRHAIHDRVEVAKPGVSPATRASQFR